jgi:hypothetical protein
MEIKLSVTCHCCFGQSNNSKNSFPRILVMLMTYLNFKIFLNHVRSSVDQADHLNGAELPRLLPDTDL